MRWLIAELGCECKLIEYRAKLRRGKWRHLARVRRQSKKQHAMNFECTTEYTTDVQDSFQAIDRSLGSPVESKRQVSFGVDSWVFVDLKDSPLEQRRDGCRGRYGSA